jgi:inner membrane protein
METQDNKRNGKFEKWIKTSISARMLMVGLLILILQIPLGYTKSLISERANRQEKVVSEINKKWGKEVLLYGPILKIPYKISKEKTYKNTQTKTFETRLTTEIKYAYFFPEKLEIQSTINPEERKRGIYKTAVYKTELNINGSFNKPNFDDIEIKDEDILWNKAKVIMETSNLKGVNSEVAITINKNNYPFTSKHKSSKNVLHENLEMHKLESKTILKNDLPLHTQTSFKMKIQINGSEQIRFIPIGKETQVGIKSNWKTANFIGNYLPQNEHKISDEGFDATWKIFEINRPFPQEFFDYYPNLKEYAFGVNFKIAVDEYQKTERSSKYGFLVIGLTFLIFFLIQTLSKINIHPFQYLMIGVALTMFYTLLISITEHSNYLNGYLIASVSVIALITLYSKSILKSFKFPILIGLSLSILYTFIFVIIQLESYALLVGSVGLFLILSGVMYASRKIDFNNHS